MDQQDKVDHKVEQYLADSTFLDSFKIILNYLINDVIKKPKSFKIGIFTIFLVIGFTSSIQSAFQLAPIVFLTIAENQAGDADLIVLPDPSQFGEAGFEGVANVGNTLLNHTQVKEACEKVDGIEGCTARWMLQGHVMAPETANLTDDEIDLSLKFKSYIIGADLIEERSVGIGRRLDIPPVTGRNVYLTGSTARGLGLKAGDEVVLNIDIINDFLLRTSDDGDQDEDGINSQIQDIIEGFLVNQFGLASNFTITVDDLREQSDNLLDIARDSEQNGTNADIIDAFEAGLVAIGVGESAAQDITEGLNLTDVADGIRDTAYGLDNDTAPINSTSVAEALTPIIINLLDFTENFTIQETVESPSGKWGDVLGHVFMVDIESFKNIFIEYATDTIIEQIYEAEDPPAALLLARTIFPRETVNETIHNATDDFNVEEYSFMTNIVMKDRVNIYQNENNIKDYVTKVSNEFYKELGHTNPSMATMPLGLAVQGLLLVKLFLDNMILVAVFLLLMLSVLLIYSLMISDVDEKTYELGMLRALGLQKVNLVTLLVLESLLFSIPGLILGLLLAYIANSAVAYMIFSGASMVTSYGLHVTAVVMALGLGFFIPLVSNYFPIKRALNKTLRDSLDMYHRAINELTIQVYKLEKMGISFSQFICALTLIVAGLTSYYFAPLAFINQNIALFLFIINLIMILMIIGVTLLANLIQPSFERALIDIFLFFNKKDRGFKSLIKKNLEGHQKRNAKTTLMYTISLAFLIFIGTGFNLQTKTIADMLASFVGCDIRVMIPPGMEENLDEQGLDKFMKQYTKQYPNNIRGYSFVSKEMSLLPLFDQPEVSPLSQFPARTQRVFGIQDNYLDSVSLEFYIPNQFDKNVDYRTLENGEKDMVQGLFTDKGLKSLDENVDNELIVSNMQQTGSPKLNSGTQEETAIKFLVSEGLREEMGMDVETPALLQFEYLSFRAANRGMATKFPGMQFSGYRNVAFWGNIIVSMEQYKYILDEFYRKAEQESDDDSRRQKIQEFRDKIPEGSTLDVPKGYLLIKFARDLDKLEIEELINGLRPYFTTDDTQVINVPNLLQSIQDNLFYIQLFSMIVSFVCMVLSFFLILVSFVANIKESSWEFGVLRAIGLNKGQITRVYLYESLSLILSSGIIGTTIGMLIAVTITLQFLMFIELPFTFLFPWGMFLTTFISGLFISVGGSYFALSEFKDQSIANIVKGLI